MSDGQGIHSVRPQSVWQGAFWLSLGSMASKVIGAVYRIVLPRLLGDYGVGLFQMAYPLYAVLLAVSINGIPTALSKQIAELTGQGRRDQADALSAWALVGLATMGTGLSLAMGLLAPWLARRVFFTPEAALAIRALAPALALVSCEAGLRGTFQGRREMIPTAVSQIVEQLTRVAVMFPLAIMLLPRGIAEAAAGATLGAPVGALAGVLFLSSRLRRGPARLRLKRPVPWAGLWKLVTVAAPMSLSGMFFPVMLLSDSMFVPERLRLTGLSMTAATAQYGQLSGEAMPLINLTMVIGAALAVSLVPAVAEYVARRNFEEACRRVDIALHLVWLVGLPMSGGLIVLARPLTHLLYGESGAATALEVLALGSSILAVQQVLGSSLQAAGHGWIPVKNLVAGASLKLALTWWLTPMPQLGIRGAAFASVMAGAMTAFLNWNDWKRIVGRTRSNREFHFGVPLAGTVVMGMAVETWERMAVVSGLIPRVATSIAIGVAVYALVLIALGEGDVVFRTWRSR